MIANSETMGDNRDKLRCYINKLESVKHIHSQILRLREMAVEAEKLRREKDLALESLKSIQELNRKTILKRDALIEQSKTEAEKTKKRLSRVLNSLKTERAHYKNRVETLTEINERLILEMKKQQEESAAKELLLEQLRVNHERESAEKERLLEQLRVNHERESTEKERLLEQLRVNHDRESAVKEEHFQRLRADYERVREALLLLNGKYKILEKRLRRSQSENRNHERREALLAQEKPGQDYRDASIRKPDLNGGSRVVDLITTEELSSPPDETSLNLKDPQRFVREYRSPENPSWYVRESRSPENPLQFVRGSHSPENPLQFVRGSRSPENPLQFVRGSRSPENPLQFVRGSRSPENPSRSARGSRSPNESILRSFDGPSNAVTGTLSPNDVEFTRLERNDMINSPLESGSNVTLDVLRPMDPTPGHLGLNSNDSQRRQTQSNSDHHEVGNPSIVSQSAEPSLCERSSCSGNDDSDASEFCQCPDPELPKLKRTASRISTKIKGFFKKKSIPSLNPTSKSKEEFVEGKCSKRRVKIEGAKTFSLSKKDIESLASNCTPLENTSNLGCSIESGEPILFSVQTLPMDDTNLALPSNGSCKSSLTDCAGELMDNPESENIPAY